MAIGVWYRVNGVVNGQSSYYEGGFEWRIVSQSTATNSSIVEFRQFARKTSSLGGMYNLYTNTSYYDIDGVRYNFASRVDMREAVANVYNYMEADGSTAVFPRCATKTVQITHLEDGTRSVPVTTYLYGGVPEGFDNITTTTTITLDALNPAESVSSDEFLKVYRLIGSTKTYVGNLAYPIDVKIEKELEYDKQTLTFKVEDIHDVKEEDYLRFYGAEWIVKEIVRNGQVFDIIAKHNIEKLEHTAIAAFKKTSKNLKTVLDDLFAFLSIPEYGIEGWTYEFGPTLDISNPSSPYYADALVVRTYTRNVDLKRVMGYEVIQEIASIWFLEVEFDTLNKKAIFHIQRGEDRGVYFSSQLNLKQINQRSDTNELITRLIPIGKDDLTIASVNGGSIALNNNTYSDKVLTAYWIDTNYTTAQSLKDDGTKRLAELAKPLVSYSCDIIDLRQVYPMLSYDLGDGVTIIDTTLNIRTSQRIVQMTVYPFHPEDNTVEMANRLLKFTDIQKDVIRSSEALRQITLPDGSVAGNNVVASDGTTHNDTTKTLVTVITDESQVSQSMTAVIFTNENQTIGATASNLVVEETVIYTGIDVLSGGVLANAVIGTVEFYDTDNNLISISPSITKVNPTNVSGGSLEIVLAPATDMTDRAGYVRVQITVNGVDYYKKIGWNLVSGTLGEDGLSAVLSNEAMTVTTLPDGSGGVYTDVQTQMKVFVGIIDDTSNWSFSATPSAGVTGAFDGVIPNLYKVTNLTTDNGYVDITATQTDYPSITKRFTISKSKNGTPGVNGLPAVSATLSADSVTLPADKDGVVASFATATTTMSVFIGDTNDSTNWTYATAVTNCTITGTNTRTVTLTAMSADVAYVDITASKSGFPSITKRFTIAKARAGQTGASGANAQYVVVNGQQAFVFPENGLNATNLVTNGDFTTDLTGWSLGAGGVWESGRLKLFSTSSAYRTQAITILANQKVYVKFNIEVLRYVAGSLGVRLNAGATTYTSLFSTNDVGIRDVSGVLTPSQNIDTIWVGNSYSANADTYFDKISIINLTTLFGAGNEPTASQMDALLSKYDTKWFDGTGSLYAVPSPAAITLTANLFGGLTVYDWEYWNGTAWANLSGTQNTQTYSVSYGATEFNGSDTLRVRCLSGAAYDEITLVRLYDGVSGQDGTDGTNGANGVSALTVLLSNEAHTLPKTAGGVITYTGSGTTIRLYEGTTELTYDGVGTSNGTWKVVATPTNITTGTLTDSGAYVTVGDHSAMTANNATISYLITGKRADGTAISITKVQSLATALQGTAGQDGTDGADGLSALSAVLSREAVSVPTDSAGNNAVYTNTTTEIRVYEGATELTYDGVGTANGTWKVIAAGTNITAGAITDSGTYATTQVVSAMTADTASIAFTISGKRADGTAFSFVKTQTFAKAKQGATGSAGTPAQYVVVNGEQAFKFLTGSATPTVTSITLTADLFGGLTTYDWEYWNGTAWANLSGTQNAQTYALAYNNAAWGTATSLRIRCLSGTYYDEVTIVKLYDGANGTNGTNGVNAVSGYLTNETVSVPTAADGTGYVLTSAGGTFKVYNGTTDVTTSATFSGGATKNGLTLAIGATTGVYTLSGASWTSNTESFTLTAVYNGVTITKVYTITKAKAGINGADGQSSKLVTILPSTTYFTSVLSGTVYVVTPDNVTLSATFQNCVFASWQYSLNAGSSFTTITRTTSSTTEPWYDSTTKLLTIPKGWSLWNTNTSIVFKVNSTTSEADSQTISFIYDIDSLESRVATTELNGATKDYVASRGENLVTNGFATLANNYNFSGFTFDGAETYYANGSFRYAGTSQQTKTTDEFIPINPNLQYKLSLYAKSLLNQGRYYMFLNCYDVDGLPIAANMTMYQPNTLTTLAQDLKNGDTVVYLTSAANWNNAAGASTHLRSIIFWNYTNSFGYVYPPLTYSRKWWYDLWADGGVNYATNTITLRVPWANGTFAAGTQVSNGSSGGTYKYMPAMSYTAIPTTWTQYTGTMAGVDLSGTNAAGKFHPGTAKVKVGWLTNYGPTPTETVWFSSVSLSIDVATIPDLETASPYHIVLSNESAAFPTDVSGATTSVITISTAIDTFKGVNRIASTIGALVLKDSAGSTITFGTLSKVNPTTTTSGSVTWSIPSGTTVSSDSGWIEIPLTIGTYSATKKIFWSKAKAGTNGANGADGTDGADGADGAPATSYWMSLSTEVVNVDQYGNYNIDSVIIEAFSQSGANPVSRYAARFRIEELINDVWQTPIETSTDEDSYEHVITAGTTQIKISTYQAGGFTVMLGSKTVVMVFDGADGEGGKYVSIAPTTNVFISTDSGSTYTPSAIKLTPQLSNAVFTKWQYSFDGEAFTDFPSAEPAKGSILSGNVLSIPNTSTLYASSMAVTFKLVAAAGAFNVYDVITITRIIDSSTTLADYVAETTTRVEDLEGFKVTVETDLYPNGIENPSEIDLLTTWQQSIDNFLLGIQSGGGYNLIKNSVGYRDPNNPTYSWVKTGAGTVYQIGASTSAFISKSESKNGIGILGTATLTQTITVAPNRAMSFAGVVNKASTGQTLQIYLTNGTNTYYLVNTTGALDGARQYVFIPASASTNWQLVIAGTSITGVLEITDLVLSYGENVTQWQQAVGEIHNLNVLIDINGMTIKALDGTTEVGYTNITPYEFAGYYQGNKIFTLNGSVTEVQELKIKKTVGATETALTMAPVRVVQAPAGLYWVWVGDIE